jgi:hypothetical protein
VNVDTAEFRALSEQVAALAGEVALCKRREFYLTLDLMDVEDVLRGWPRPGGRSGRAGRRRRGPGERPAHLRLVRGGAR